MQTLNLKKKYEKYPEYKNSGVEWLGEIPWGWNVERLKHVSIMNSKTLREDTSPDFKFKYFDIGSVDGQGDAKIEDEILFADSPSRARRLVSSGDSIISTVRTYLKAISYFDEVKDNIVASTGFAVLTPKEKLYPKYLYYYLLSDRFINQVIVRSKGVSYPAITPIDLKSLEINYPSKEEQEKIAAYLDEKTSYIDQIIERKQKQIGLLVEKRTAVINHAVTRGLGSKVELTNSGIEWIDMVPKTWKVKKLKFLGEAIIGLTYSPEELVSDGSGTLVLRSSNVQDDKIVLTDNVFVNKTIPKKLITRVGDILICSRNGSRALIGKNALIDDSSAGLSFGAFMTIFRTKNSRFISYFLKSNLFMSQLSTTLTSTINQLTTHYLNNITAIIPSEKEQEEIVDYLDKKVDDYNRAIKSAEDSIEKLKEFKSSLISNVVTGKIKL